MIWLIVFGLGFLTCIVGQFLLLIAGFRTSVVWGLLLMFLPITVWVFIFSHWDRAQVPIATQIIGALIAVLGMFQLQSSALTEENWGPFEEFMIAVLEEHGEVSPPSDNALEDGHKPEGKTPEMPEENSDVEEADQEGFLSGLLGNKDADDDATTDEQGPEDMPPEQRNWKGVRVSDVYQDLGEPTASMKRGNSLLIIYKNLELVSDDGEVITSQSVLK